MKKKFIQEDIFNSFCWFVWDCDLKELQKWVEKKFNYRIRISLGWCGGKTIYIEDEQKGTQNWIIWVNDKKNIVSLAHELIHFCWYIFKYNEMVLSNDNEEVFTRLHTYYFEKCLKYLK